MAKSKWEKEAAVLHQKRKKLNRKERKKDVGRAGEVRFNFGDDQQFYENRAVLPAAAAWNLDEFLAAFLAAGIEKLLTGPTDWDFHETKSGKNARKQLKKAMRLFRMYAKDGSIKKPLCGDRALLILADVGMSRLFD